MQKKKLRIKKQATHSSTKKLINQKRIRQNRTLINNKMKIFRSSRKKAHYLN